MMKVLVVLMLVCSVYANEIKTLSDQQPCLQDVHAALREITASLAKQELEVKNLQAENKGKQVAFSASLLATGGQTFGPFKKQTPLVYKHVVTNIGNAYSPVTGAFTAPLRGAYHFQLHVFRFGGPTTGASLFKNSEHIFIAFERQPSHGAHESSASSSVTLLLQAGDAVSVRLVANARVYENHFHHNTFSGHLLFTM